MIYFLACCCVLVFALCHAQETTTKAWIIFCILLNLAAIGVALHTGAPPPPDIG